MTSEKTWQGYVWVSFAAILWAVSGSAAKFLFHQGISAFQLVQLRLVMAAGMLALGFAVFRPALLRIRIGDIPYFILLGGGAMAAVQFTYLFTISKIHVAAAILLEYLAPSFIALYTIVVTREKPSRTTLISVVSATVGCYLVVGAYRLDILSLNRIGIASGVLSAVAFAWYSIQGEYGLRKYTPWTVLIYAMAFGAVSWNIFHPPFEAFRHAYSPAVWGWILYIAILGTAVPFGLYFKGVGMIRATRASITATLEPITAGLISFIFLDERFSLLQITGGLLVILSILMLQIPWKTADESLP